MKKTISHENQVPKSYHCFYVKKFFYLAPCRTKRIHFSQPWFEAFRSSSTLFLFVALSPTSYLITPNRVRPYSTWLVIYSSFCAPKMLTRPKTAKMSRLCIHTENTLNLSRKAFPRNKQHIIAIYKQ